MVRRSRILPAVLALAMLFSACIDRGPVDPPPPRLFDRYVALGNSITAGFESDGINDSTQVGSYSVLLAGAFNASFNVPRLRKPGCPPPLVGPAPLTNQRVAGADPASCGGFETPISQPVQNLAFPGFKIADALTVPGGLFGLVYRQAIGNRSLVQAMADANPTFVSIWLGNNDALSAGTTGNLAHLTSVQEFRSSLATIVAAVAAEPTLRDAVILGVIDPQYAPLLQPGVYFWLLGHDPEGTVSLNKPVHANCAPLTPTGQPNPLARNLVSFRVLADAAVPEVSCADDAPYVLNPQEQAAISARVEEYNTALRESATNQQWIYVDANQEIVGPQLGNPDQIRKCQALEAAQTLEALIAAAEQTCPHPDAPNFFGSSTSFDGVHPSVQGQQIVYQVLHAAIVQKHGLNP
jgi:hypothetical protein